MSEALADLDGLFDVLPPSSGDVFNPWADRCPDLDLEADAALARRGRLARHLAAPAATLLLVGEAPGYAGCRYSGIAFTSERLLYENAIPRLEEPVAGRITRRERPFSEPSATIVWGTLFRLQLAERVILWNAFPVHPIKRGQRLTNRPPTSAELDAGIPALEWMVKRFSGAAVIAVGENAKIALTRAGVPFRARIRHPANGGATLFAEQLASACADLRS